MKLLDLPDELLSPIIIETMWATTSMPASPPDMLMWERRLANHPSLRRKKVAYVGQICGRLRRIAMTHLVLATVWADESIVVEVDRNTNLLITRELPETLLSESLAAIVFSAGQAVFLAGLPLPTLEHLRELTVTWTSMEMPSHVDYEDDFLAALAKCRSLVKVDLAFVRLLEEGPRRQVFKALASLSALQTLRLHKVNSLEAVLGSSPLGRSPILLHSTWSAPLVRLEVHTVVGATFPWLVHVMQQAATTIEVVIFQHTDVGRLDSSRPFTIADAVIFPRLWRLDVNFGVPGTRYRDFSEAGISQLGGYSPIDVWRAAPQLEYLECGERLRVKTQAQLDELHELCGRGGGIKRLRLKLDTWEGDKGPRWSRDVDQELVVG